MEMSKKEARDILIDMLPNIKDKSEKQALGLAIDELYEDTKSFNKKEIKKELRILTHTHSQDCGVV